MMIPTMMHVESNSVSSRQGTAEGRCVGGGGLDMESIAMETLGSGTADCQFYLVLVLESESEKGGGRAEQLFTLHKTL